MSKVIKILLLLFIAVMLIITFVTGVSPLFAKLGGASDIDSVFGNYVEEGGYVEGEIHYTMGEFAEIVNIIVIVPVGSEHYYLTFDEYMSTYLVVRAEKGWEKNFADGISPDGVKVSGVAKSIPSDISLSLKSAIHEFNSEGFYPEATSVYIDCYAVQNAVMLLVGGVIAVICTVMMLVSYKLYWRKPLAVSLMILVIDVLYMIVVMMKV